MLILVLLFWSTSHKIILTGYSSDDAEFWKYHNDQCSKQLQVLGIYNNNILAHATKGHAVVTPGGLVLKTPHDWHKMLNYVHNH